MINIDAVKEYAFESHAQVNHMYDDMPYSAHLKMTAQVAKDFIHLIPRDYREQVIAAAYCHDILEDTHQTYNDLKKKVRSHLVAEIVYAVTNDKGRTRAERAGKKYYDGIRSQQFASFIKLCDRIANVTYSKSTGSSMYGKYKLELESFLKSVVSPDKIVAYHELFELLNQLFIG